MEKLYFFEDSYNVVGFNSAFFLLMTKKIKNLKISVETHDILKKYCDKKGLKMYKYLENLIRENCSEKRDIYGEL